MKFEVHNFRHGDRQVEDRLRGVEGKLDLIIQKLETIMPTLDELLAKSTTTLAQITKNTDLDNSIIALVTANNAQITDLKAQLAAAGTDPAKLQALSDTMDAILSGATSQGQSVADAVTANTPAA